MDAMRGREEGAGGGIQERVGADCASIVDEDEDGARRSKEARVMWMGRDDKEADDEVLPEEADKAEAVRAEVASEEGSVPVMEARELDEEDLPGVAALRTGFMTSRAREGR